MKIRPLMKLLCMLSVSLLFASCGKNGSNSSTSASASSSVGACQIGQVSTSQGCLPSDGVYGYGLGNNGQPISGSCWSGTTMTQYGCQSNGNSTFGTVGGGTGSGSTSCQPYAACSTGTICYSPSMGYFCD